MHHARCAFWIMYWFNCLLQYACVWYEVSMRISRAYLLVHERINWSHTHTHSTCVSSISLKFSVDNWIGRAAWNAHFKRIKYDRTCMIYSRLILIHRFHFNTFSHLYGLTSGASTRTFECFLASALFSPNISLLLRLLAKILKHENSAKVPVNLWALSTCTNPKMHWIFFEI